MIILGAGGHANEILDVLSKSFSSEELFLFDDTGAETKIYNHRFSRLLRSVLQLEEVLRHNPAFCVAVGNPKIRHKLTELALRYGGRPDNAIAQTAYVSPVAEVGTGLNIMHMSYISPGAIIEDGVLINTGALIHHDVIVSQYAEISPGATLLGGVVGIWMAFQGYGVYALVVQSLTAGVISTILLWSISGWKPSMEFSKHEIKKLWSFGSYVFLSGILADIMKRTDVLIIGKLFSPATLGFLIFSEAHPRHLSSSVTCVY